MDHYDILRIEEELSITLPASYKNTMLDHPFKGRCSANDMLCDSPDDLIAENIKIRKKGFWGISWSNAWFIIGFDGCGNYYFIDLHGNDETVFFADHESLFDPNAIKHIEVKYENMKEFINFLEEIEKEIMEDELLFKKEKQAIKKINPKTSKWWRFWK